MGGSGFFIHCGSYISIASMAIILIQVHHGTLSRGLDNDLAESFSKLCLGGLLLSVFPQMPNLCPLPSTVVSPRNVSHM